MSKIISDKLGESALIPIVKRNGITISGKIIGPGARLGQFMVKHKTDSGGPYALMSEAEAKMDSIEYILRQQDLKERGIAPDKPRNSGNRHRY